MTASQHTIDLIAGAVRAADSTGGDDFVALDVSEQLPFADAFLLVTGNSERNVDGIADAVETALRDLGVSARRREGRGAGRWVLLDFDDLVVHVFHSEDRQYYGLERLWSDCPTIAVNELIATSE